MKSRKESETIRCYKIKAKLHSEYFIVFAEGSTELVYSCVHSNSDLNSRRQRFYLA